MSEFHSVLLLADPALELPEEIVAVVGSLQLQVVAAAEHVSDSGQLLHWDGQVLSLWSLGRKAPGPVRVEFAGGAADHRRKFGGGSGQMIAKAVGVKLSRPLTVLDATAGLGRDAFVLAGLGCQVLLQERQPVVAALLQDGLRRAGLSADPEVRGIIARMTLLQADSLAAMPSADVVYLDPMFPERSKSASVKKEMALFHHLVGADSDADGLLERALQAARYRVVVKRPRKAPFLADCKPSYELSGKTSRYDIYVNARLPD
ncbi:class I SAM-dependent methyltransferase [Pseudomaricurvus sp. HS19]|uniref:class I SAM-dependent methyltransferase n=1 Tax=Pseudomaricurvus sp. HS19 TaxID=2692626 RepID=UPI00136F0704|nr:class I SAM-dependent methyltransferase [Pseudomaricurvus sp. HS19]MYM65059.1 class I SAM-dependent methyltransferase [Pseudomaricurvus sp. HS19]